MKLTDQGQHKCLILAAKILVGVGVFILLAWRFDLEVVAAQIPDLAAWMIVAAIGGCPRIHDYKRLAM